VRESHMRVRVAARCADRRSTQHSSVRSTRDGRARECTA
jgi:hypothetical protein